MKPVQPRTLVHRGRVEASGLFFPSAAPGLEEARRRILAAWEPGTEVYSVPEGLVLRWTAPRPVRCETAPGLPLVSTGVDGRRVLAAAPLAGEELRCLDPVPGSAVLVRAGEAVVRPLPEEDRQDPASWLGSPFEVVETISLGAAPPPPPALLAEGTFDPRSKLHAAGSALPALREVTRALSTARGGASGEAGTESPVRGLGAEAASAAASALSAMGRMFAWIERQVRKSIPAEPAGRGERSGRAGQPAPPPPGSDALLRRFLALTRLSTIIGRQHGQYLGRMIRMFERGDLAEALRHAVPLGSGAACGGGWLALFPPSPRADLSLSTHPAGAGASIGVVDEVLDYLRTLYRRAFERLEAEGRIDEAAFVLVELLGENEEAVAFLERHGRLRLAAELAEGRNLPAGLAVRQWFIAGDRERAVLLARRTGAFADAVLRLERSRSELAAELRRLWAESLAEAADYAGAVEAIWPVEAERGRACTWIELAIAAGGRSGAGMLARRITLLPEAAEETVPQVLRLLEDPDREGVPLRTSFAETLLKGDANPLAKTVARAAVRALARDVQLHSDINALQVFGKMVQFAGDASLRADAPRLEIPGYRLSSLRLREGPLELSMAAGDSGALPAHDAAMLPDGRCLVALGEAGVRLLTRDGRTAAHFDQPAHSLVLSDHGNRAIALGRRGDVHRLARIDLTTLRSEAWCEASLDAFAGTYDGSTWFAAAGGTLMGVDATAPRLGTLWRLQEPDAKVHAVSRSASQMSALVMRSGAKDDWGRPSAPWELWQRLTFSLPGPVLRLRSEVPAGDPGDTARAHALSPSGRVYRYRVLPDEEGVDSVQAVLEIQDSPTRPSWKRVLPGAPLPLAANEDAAAVLVREPGGVTCDLLLKRQFDRPHFDRVVNLQLHGAALAAARLQEDHLVVVDDRGRLVVLELQSGRVVRDQRLR